MKCVTKSDKTPRILLPVGLLLLAAGIIAARMSGEDGAVVRIAGFVSGLGGSIAAIAIAIMIRRRLLGPQKSEDSQLEMIDERGQMIGYKAQSVFALCAVLCLVVLIVVATVRGDTLYMMLGAMGCLACAVAKWAAMTVYSRRM